MGPWEVEGAAVGGVPVGLAAGVVLAAWVAVGPPDGVCAGRTGEAVGLAGVGANRVGGVVARAVLVGAAEAVGVAVAGGAAGAGRQAAANVASSNKTTRRYIFFMCRFFNPFLKACGSAGAGQPASRGLNFFVRRAAASDNRPAG